jgi:xanthine dehydrogenase molybdopterin-binding subunit B
MPPVVNIGTVVGTYTTPAVHVEVSGMLTNTHCKSPYRGAGRPEASYMIERLIDIAADAATTKDRLGSRTSLDVNRRRSAYPQYLSNHAISEAR